MHIGQVIFVNLQMLKNICFFVIVAAITMSCHERSSQVVIHERPKDTLSVFPVTDYLLGQLSNIEAMPTTPLKLTGEEGKADSSWIRREDVRALAAPFLHPVIDSASLQKYFNGNSFFDQTIGSVTFTYTPKADAGSNAELREINVYVNPNTNKVQRIYLVKESGDTTLQLTWKSGSWFSIRSIVDNKIKEEKVKWSFSE